MFKCPKFGNFSTSLRKVIISSILWWFDQKTDFAEGCYWFKFNNLELVLGMAFRFYNNMAKGLTLKIKKLWKLIFTPGDVMGENIFCWFSFLCCYTELLHSETNYQKFSKAATYVNFKLKMHFQSKCKSYLTHFFKKILISYSWRLLCNVNLLRLKFITPFLFDTRN